MLTVLKNKLKGTRGYDTSKKDIDVVALLMMIRSYCCQFNTLNDEYMLIVGAIKNLLYFFQKTTQCNTGVTKMNLEGELGGMTVHHTPKSIANVLSLKCVAEMHRVTYGSWYRGGVFMVHTPNGVVEFKPSVRGLHYMDVSADETVRHMLVMDGMPDH